MYFSVSSGAIMFKLDEYERRWFTVFTEKKKYYHYENTTVQIYWKFYNQKRKIFRKKKKKKKKKTAENVTQSAGVKAGIILPRSFWSELNVTGCQSKQIRMVNSVEFSSYSSYIIRVCILKQAGYIFKGGRLWGVGGEVEKRDNCQNHFASFLKRDLL